MTLQIPEEIAQSAREMAQQSGETAESLLLSALGAHFPMPSPALLEEFAAWETASDEDMAKFDAKEMTTP